MKTLELSQAESKPTLFGALRNIGRGIYNRTENFATAKLASYKAAFPTTTTGVGTRYGTNPNYSSARIQQAAMYFTAEGVAKNDPVAAMYLNTRRNYCRPKLFIPNTGDAVLNKDITDFLKERWKTGGINCSMFVAFGRSANIELPVRGDSGMVMMRDNGRIKWMEFSADQVGEPFYFIAPRATSLAYNATGDLIEVAGGDLRYYAGVYYSRTSGTNVAFKIYERQNSWYGNPQIIPASDVIFFRDDIFRGIRGITKFANALQYMEKGDTLFQSGMDAAMRQATTSLIVKNARGEAEEGTYQDIQLPNGNVTHVENRSAQGPRTEYYYSGTDVDFMAPVAPGNEVIQGCEHSQELVAGALGLTYAFLFSGKNIGGAPSRLDTNKCTKEIDRINEDVLLDPLHRISYVEIMDGVAQGYFPAQPSITNGHWPFVTSPTSDQFRESEQDIEEVRAGLNSEIRVISKDGATPQQIISEKAEYAFQKFEALEKLNKRMKEAGLTSVATIADIGSITDNPLEAAQASALDKNKPINGQVLPEPVGVAA